MARELPIEAECAHPWLEGMWKQARIDMDNLQGDSLGKIQLARAYAQNAAASIANDVAREWNWTPDNPADESHSERGSILVDAIVAVYGAAADLQRAAEEAEGCLDAVEPPQSA